MKVQSHDRPRHSAAFHHNTTRVASLSSSIAAVHWESSSLDFDPQQQQDSPDLGTTVDTANSACRWATRRTKNGGGVTPFSSAHRSFSSSLKQQHLSQQNSAVEQPQGQASQGKRWSEDRGEDLEETGTKRQPDSAPPNTSNITDAMLRRIKPGRMEWANSGIKRIRTRSVGNARSSLEAVWSVAGESTTPSASPDQKPRSKELFAAKCVRDRRVVNVRTCRHVGPVRPSTMSRRRSSTRTCLAAFSARRLSRPLPTRAPTSPHANIHDPALVSYVHLRACDDRNRRIRRPTASSRDRHLGRRHGLR